MKRFNRLSSRGLLFIFVAFCPFAVHAAWGQHPAEADLIVYHGKVITVDPQFSIVSAMAVKDGKIIAVGSDEQVLAGKGPKTILQDLQGKTVLPGLIDSHVHPGAAMTEFDHPVPEMESIDDVLTYVKQRAAAVGPGKWVEVSQVFITRLKEQRYPSRAELDAAAPENPVVFATGPDASLSTLALKMSGIDKDFKVTDGGPGYAEKDATTGEPTGILRGCTRYVKSVSPEKRPTEEDRYRRTLELFKDYNASGLTTICDRLAEPDAIARYAKMRDVGDLPIRVAISEHVATIGAMDSIEKHIRAIAKSPLRKDDPMLQIIGIKIFLDGGMLTGSAYMLQPWGVSKTYSITDPSYRGVLLVPPQRLLPIAKTAAESGLQFTAHSVGDGAVHLLLDTYEKIEKDLPPGALQATRPCITHCNFVDPADIPRFHALGVSADMQPVWLYLDARTLSAHFGNQRLSRFQPLHDLFAADALIGGGSDHMQKIGARRAINAYDPFLGMGTTITRTARWYDGALHPEQALTRQQMLRMYTINNAWLLFKEKQVGSLEKGKFADFIVVDTDVMTCPPEKIADTKVLQTYLAGKKMFERKNTASAGSLINGTWKPEHEIVHGKEQTADLLKMTYTYCFEDGKFFPIPEDRTMVGSYMVDEGKSPHRIDIVFPKGLHTPDEHGIYELDGDTLRMSSRFGESAPADFQPREDNYVITFNRVATIQAKK
ncbi:MAG TPA: amidohydrolase family protein [Tepidisphaeraceae bacterium]|nr:amidohydrolase family protein [Tepidisphaeraceae bacterium]